MKNPYIKAAYRKMRIFFPEDFSVPIIYCRNTQYVPWLWQKSSSTTHNIFLAHFFFSWYNPLDFLTPVCSISWTSWIPIPFIWGNQKVELLQSFFCISVFTAVRQHSFPYNLKGQEGEKKAELSYTHIFILSSTVLSST